jgi:Vitamin K-dependent gamma-carboxylase
MSLRSVANAWSQFFFEPVAPTSIALYRILFGLLVIANSILLWPDWLNWYGNDGFLSMETVREAGTRLNLFLILPPDDRWSLAFFWIFLLFAISLTIGFQTRLSSIAVFLCLTSMHQRNLFILNGGDTLLRVTGFFLMLAPAGAAMSVDRLIRIWRGHEGIKIQAQSPWAQRMIQIETAVAYLATFYWKTLGATWANGTAMHYVSRLEELRRFPAPQIDNVLLLKFFTWSALLIELSCAVLIWFKETRYAILGLGLCLHLGIEYTMNIPLFQWIILSTYVTFIPPEDLSRFWSWIRGRFTARFPSYATVIYDGTSVSCARAADVLRAIDILGRLQFAGDGASRTMEVRTGAMVVSGARLGIRGLVALAPFVPLLWPLVPARLFTRQSKDTVSAVRAAK